MGRPTHVRRLAEGIKLDKIREKLICQHCGTPNRRVLRNIAEQACKRCKRKQLRFKRIDFASQKGR